MAIADGFSDTSRLTATGAARPDVRIVHLGLGAFFRAHGASYLADLGGWGVLGVSLRSPVVRDALVPQDCVYTAAELTPDGIKPRQIEVLRDVLVAPENPQAVIDAIADPNVCIVSLTVTEKGYCHDPASGRLNMSHPDIVRDQTQYHPSSAIGYLVRGLQARWQAGAAPLTIMSCDNLPDNGALTRRVVLRLAQEIAPDAVDWIKASCTFPSAMVDRIVPATTSTDIETLNTLVGQRDAAPVMHEPFRQWVIENEFAGDRPAFEDAGVQLVDDILPFELMKLRMLNGAHSALAYLGYLSGHNTVSEAAADPVLATYLRHLWRREIAPTLIAPPDTDLDHYAATLLERFANPAIQHKTYQIAMDGSQKLPQRLLGTILDRLNNGKDADALLLGVAGWMRFTGGIDEAGTPFDVQDPLAPALRAAQSADPATTVGNLLAMREIFDASCAARIEPVLVRLYQGLSDHGARHMMSALTG